MISYSSNGEDVVLARLFTGTEGTYVDLGAGHPVRDSVTKHFSLRGWRGLNVEPLPEEHRLLTEDRPRDVCVRAAVTDRSGTVTLHVAPPGLRGRDTTVAAVAAELGTDPEQDALEVPSIRLTDLLVENELGPIDFLKIDVEGAEAMVVNDTDWTLIRPRVLVIAATEPGRPTPSYEEWEPQLFDAGYRCTLFDGVNRFYADAEDDEAFAVLSVPANVHDGARPHRWLDQVHAMEEQYRAERARRLDAEERLAAVAAAVSSTAAVARRQAQRADPDGQLLAAGPLAG